MYPRRKESATMVAAERFRPQPGEKPEVGRFLKLHNTSLTRKRENCSGKRYVFTRLYCGLVFARQPCLRRDGTPSDRSNRESGFGSNQEVSPDPRWGCHFFLS